MGALEARGLRGKTVVLLEARRAKEASALVRRYGGTPWSVPAMREVPLGDRSEAAAGLRDVCAHGCDVAIFLTGVGTRALFELADDLDLATSLRVALDRSLIVVRGPKPRVALGELGVRIDRQAAEPSTSRQVLNLFSEADRPLGRVLMQLHGQRDPVLRAGLETFGAQLIEMPLYRWALPDDTGPLLALIDNLSGADALAVTSAGQVHNLFSLADSHGCGAELRRAFGGNLAVAAVGPVAGQALRDQGVCVAVEPEH
ncbi:MAG: uroporphyrinogen-III synthase, partial [Chloroflexota bacterium]